MNVDRVLLENLLARLLEAFEQGNEREFESLLGAFPELDPDLRTLCERLVELGLLRPPEGGSPPGEAGGGRKKEAGPRAANARRRGGPGRGAADR